MTRLTFQLAPADIGVFVEYVLACWGMLAPVLEIPPAGFAHLWKTKVQHTRGVVFIGRHAGKPKMLICGTCGLKDSVANRRVRLFARIWTNFFWATVCYRSHHARRCLFVRSMSDHDDPLGPPLPASETKHLPLLHHPVPGTSVVLPLRQVSSSTTSEDGSTGTTGTTLWLSAQLLALYLLTSSAPTSGAGRKLALDLGSGIGYLPLCLAHHGYDTIATDIPEVIEHVLGHNVQQGLSALSSASDLGRKAGKIDVIALDWTSDAIPEAIRGRKLDMITTSDTVYAPHLLDPLLVTLRRLSASQQHQPTIYVSLERRDSALIDDALSRAAQMGLALRRIDKAKIDRVMDDANWDQEGWDDVEIWKGKFSRASLAAITCP